jgi:hypothetical protein
LTVWKLWNTRRKSRFLAKTLGGANDLPKDAIEKLDQYSRKSRLSDRKSALPVLRLSGRCRNRCAHETAKRFFKSQKFKRRRENSLSREELIELLAQMANWVKLASFRNFTA